MGYGLPMLRALLIPTVAGLAITGCGSTVPTSRPATATPTAAAAVDPLKDGRLQATLVDDLEHWLTANSPAGVTAKLSGVTCEDIGRSQYKCVARGELRGDDGSSESGHMTVVATVKDGSYSWEPVEFWTAGDS